MGGTQKVSRDCVLENKLGLHARPASLFARTAAQFSADISVSRDDNVVDGKSILGLLMLAAGKGSALVIEAAGEDAQEAANALAGLIASKFGEE